MKKLNLFLTLPVVVILSVLFCGCDKISITEEHPDIEEYLDLDITNISQMNSHQLAIYDKTSKRLENYLVKKDGKLMLDIINGKKVNISDRLFKYMEKQLESFNKMHENVMKSGNLMLEISKYRYMLVIPDVNFNFIKTKGDGWDGGAIGENGGVTTIAFSPFSIQIFLSNQTLNTWSNQLFAGASLSVLFATMFPAIAPETALLSCITGLLSRGLDVLKDEYHDGLVITCSYTGVPIVDILLSGVSAQTPDDK